MWPWDRTLRSMSTILVPCTSYYYLSMVFVSNLDVQGCWINGFGLFQIWPRDCTFELR